MPMKFKLSAGFGELTEVHSTPHNGIDIPLQVGTKLRSICDGYVERVVDYGNANVGKGVIIRASDGTHHIYGHLSKVMVHVGDRIHAGAEVIGLSGDSGRSTGPHLHFGIQAADGHFVDPTPALANLEAAAGNVPAGFMDHVNHFADSFIGKQTEIIFKPIANFITDRLMDMWHWFVANIPEIMGYGTLMAAAFIIIGAMIGKGGMIKPLSIYAAGLIAAILIRENA